MRYHFTPTRMAIIIKTKLKNNNNQKIKNVEENVERLEILHIAAGNVK